MDIFNQIKQILIDLLDVEPDEIKPETYLVRDLGAESIDFLELAVALNAGFNIQVNDDALFLKKLRSYVTQESRSRQDALATIGAAYPFLPLQRLRDILEEMEAGPVLKVMDVVDYVNWQTGRLAEAV